MRGRAAAQGGDAGRQRGVAEPLLGLLEPLLGCLQVAGLQGALTESEQRVGLLGDQPVLLRLREDDREPLGGGLRGTVGEGALGAGQAQPQLGGEPGGAAGGQFLEPHAEPFGDVPQGRFGGPDPAGLQGRDVCRGVRRFRQLTLCEALFRPQSLHSAPDDLGIVTLGRTCHDVSMPGAPVTPAALPQLPSVLLPLAGQSPTLNDTLSALTSPALMTVANAVPR